MSIQIIKNYINGEWKESESEQLLDVINPAKNEVIAKVPLSTTKEVIQAIEFAITGELPEFKSFTKEDALVNSYAQKPIATVSLVLSDQNDNFTIERVRKKSSILYRI